MPMSIQDQQRLRGVHPDLIRILADVFDEMDAEGTPMFVVQGVRTEAEQVKLYARGRIEPGEIVTNCDGIKHKSPHQVREDGFGYAVDCAFVGSQPFDSRHPWEMFGHVLESKGLVWGGRFSHPVDLDHAELKPKDRTPV